MKKITLLLCAILVTLSSCSDDDDNTNQVLLTESEIPTAITTYVNTHFADNTIDRAVKDMDNNTIEYDIYLSGNFTLEFNADYEIIDIDGVTALPDSVIPPAILIYVNENYPQQFIRGWELEMDYQQVELNNNIELEFTMTGEFIRID